MENVTSEEKTSKTGRKKKGETLGLSYEIKLQKIFSKKE